MIGFLLFAALLAGLALWLLLPPLARGGAAARLPADEQAINVSVLREQLAQIDAELASGAIDAGQHRLARAELERRVLDEEQVAERAAVRQPATKTAWALGLALPLFAAATYAWLGTPIAVTPQPAAAAKAAEAAGGASRQEVEAMVDKLAQRMQAEPGNAKGWAMLARAYAGLQRFPEASAAYAKAAALTPDDAALLADYADALAMTQGQVFAGEPTRLIERALRIDPGNLKLLALAAGAAQERQDYQAAAGFWQQALQKVPPGSEIAVAIERNLAEVLAQAPAGPGPAASGSAVGVAKPLTAARAQTGPASGAGQFSGQFSGQISGRISLAPALAARVQPGDTVFVFARAAEGPRMPLAILRRTAGELPFSFKLDDSQAMAPDMQLSKFEQVVVSVRVSRSGDATPRSGDLLGQSAPLRTGSSNIELVIDRVQP